MYFGWVGEFGMPAVLPVEPVHHLLVRAAGGALVDRQQPTDRAAPLQLLGRLGEPRQHAHVLFERLDKLLVFLVSPTAA